MAVDQILSSKAWNILKEDHLSVLIDVRNNTELENDGKPCIKSCASSKLLFISWAPSAEAMNNLVLLTEIFSNKQKLLFICNSGYRSLLFANALDNKGYDCYNILDGFSGNQHGLGWHGNKLPINRGKNAK